MDVDIRQPPPLAGVVEPLAPRLTPPARSAPRCSRWSGYALIACGAALLPWLVVLAVTLPGTGAGGHWTVAWVGLDSMEAAGLVSTGVLVLRQHRALPVVAAGTAMLLVIDAWFDATTAEAGGDLVGALVMAFAAELPLAAACAVVAVRSLPRPPTASPSLAGQAENVLERRTG
jgi:hypothetical protein